MNLHILALRLLLDPLLKPFWEEVELAVDLPSLSIQPNHCIYLYVKDGISCFSITGHSAERFAQPYIPVIEKYSLRFVSLESKASVYP